MNLVAQAHTSTHKHTQASKLRTYVYHRMVPVKTPMKVYKHGTYT